MNTRKLVLLPLLFLSCLNNVSAKDTDNKYDKVKIQSQKLVDGIYMLTGEGGNIGISAGDDGVFMIDDQFAPLSEKIKQAISDISAQPIRFLINTHWHFDHTGGNENFGKEGVVIVAHDNVRERMSKDGFIKAFNMAVPAAANIALPAITFNDSVSFHLNGQDIEVIHRRNAHTDGDSIVFFNSDNVIHTGDIFFNGFYPFIDASSDGNVTGVIKAVEYILSKTDDETKIIPGHGPLANKGDLQNYHKMLITVRDRMQKLIDEGLTLEEIIALKPNADLDKTWGKGFLPPESFLTILHAAMDKK